MYVHEIPNRTSPPAILLRQSYREGAKVKTRTLANLTHWPAERIEALRRTLKGEFDGVIPEGEPISGPIFGVLFVLKALADRLGLTKALGPSRVARLALFLVLARVAHQGSRLSAVRWAQNHTVAEVLGVGRFDEDDLYGALDWLAEHQEAIEQTLYRGYVKRNGAPPVLVLYDVTSSYLEGEQNELADWGHNRDGKRGKKQVVIGLLTAADGEPLAVKVFRGNTSDPTTIGDAIEALKERFGIEEVVFVGDRGMVKSKGKKALRGGGGGFRYITALTDPQVRKLLREKVLEPELFDPVVQEVEHAGKRLVVRRNEAVRRKETHRREDKLGKLAQKIAERNAFVAGSKRAKPEAGLRTWTQWVKRHKLSSFVTVRLEERVLVWEVDDEAKEEAALLDGCYVLETDVAAVKLSAAEVDARYRDLAQVERLFRMMKTGLLEVRPIFVRKASRTRGHVFAAMLALKIGREMNAGLGAAFGTTDDDKWAVTLDDALEALSRLCFSIYDVGGQRIERLLGPDSRQEAILEALGIRWPQQRARARQAA
jgi:hypothetical protein